MSQVRISAQAEADLKDIWVYIARSNAGAADKLIAGVIEKYQSLASFPLMGRSREELAQGLRSYPVGKYLIFYRPIDAGIEVVRVLHGARDLPSHFEE